MQYSGEAKLATGDASVLFVFDAAVPHVGTFQVGETLNFSGGGVGVCTNYTSGLLSYVIPGDTKPLAGETVDGVTSLVSTTLTLLQTDPNLVNFGIDAGDLLSRVDDRVAYYVASVPQAWRLELAANYAGASAAEASVIIHNTRTTFADLPLLDNRDRQQFVLTNEALRIIAAYLEDHEARIAALEP